MKKTMSGQTISIREKKPMGLMLREELDGVTKEHFEMAIPKLEWKQIQPEDMYPYDKEGVDRIVKEIKDRFENEIKESKYTEFQTYCRLGVNDLKPTVKIQWSGGEWGKWVDNFPDLTEEEAQVKIQENIEWNENYIKELKDKGEYKKRVPGTLIKIQHDPLYDTPNPNLKQSTKENYRLVWLDLNTNKEKIEKLKC